MGQAKSTQEAIGEVVLGAIVAQLTTLLQRIVGLCWWGRKVWAATAEQHRYAAGIVVMSMFRGDL